jgi:hypothetical protein
MLPVTACRPAHRHPDDGPTLPRHTHRGLSEPPQRGGLSVDLGLDSSRQDGHSLSVREMAVCARPTSADQWDGSQQRWSFLVPLRSSLWV